MSESGHPGNQLWKVEDDAMVPTRTSVCRSLPGAQPETTWNCPCDGKDVIYSLLGRRAAKHVCDMKPPRTK